MKLERINPAVGKVAWRGDAINRSDLSVEIFAGIKPAMKEESRKAATWKSNCVLQFRLDPDESSSILSFDRPTVQRLSQGISDPVRIKADRSLSNPPI